MLEDPIIYYFINYTLPKFLLILSAGSVTMSLLMILAEGIGDE